MVYSEEELLEAKRQIDSTLHKLAEAVKTLEEKKALPAINLRSPWLSGASKPLPLQWI